MSQKYWKAVKKTSKKNIFETGDMGGSKATLFEIGRTYEVEGKPKLCNNGFHFYREEDFIFGLKLFGEGKTEFIEVEPLSEVILDTEKLVCCKIRIIRYVSRKERHKLIKKNMDSGNMNSGYRNSGNMNSGDRNSGNMNSGYRNSGNMNSGYRNSGDMNSGNMNSGDMNSGNMNSGDGYRNYFCTETKYFLFDTEVSKETIDNVQAISMGWFSLDNRTYFEAWVACPEEVLSQFAQLTEFQTVSGRQKFTEITGLVLPIILPEEEKT